MANLPKPVPIFGSVFGYDANMIAKATQLKAKTLAEYMQRQLTEDEINATAFWTAKQVSLMSYGPPTGIVAGLWRSYKTRETMRFPFFQPDFETLEKEIFPHARMALLRGNRAVFAWHALRSLGYMGFGMFFSGMFFGSYAMSVAAVGEVGDPRLKAVTEEMRKRSREKKIQSTGSAQGQQRTPPRAPMVKEDSSRISGMYGGQTPDDASPTGGMYGGAETTAPIEQTQWKPLPQSNPAPVPMSAPEPQSETFDFFGEDTQKPAQQPAAANTQPQQGSAWERLRRQKAAGSGWDNVRKTQGPEQSEWSRQQGQEQKERKQGSSFGDSYVEERNYAKEEAQKEFDDRIERERRGGNFGEGSGRL